MYKELDSYILYIKYKKCVFFESDIHEKILTYLIYVQIATDITRY